jgi:translation initiation factor IF-3
LAIKKNRVNEMIRTSTVRLIDEKGAQKGVMPTLQALEIAREIGLDLVEVSPDANPPVCKILDYGKYRFEQEKKNRESKKKQKQKKLKEIRMQPKIEKHDLSFKVRHIRDFLEDGNKVKVTVRFRGREMAHTELGRDVLDKILALLDNSYNLDVPPKMEGRFMSMLLSPTSKTKKG